MAGTSTGQRVARQIESWSSKYPPAWTLPHIDRVFACPCKDFREKQGIVYLPRSCIRSNHPGILHCYTSAMGGAQVFWRIERYACWWAMVLALATPLEQTKINKMNQLPLLVGRHGFCLVRMFAPQAVHANAPKQGKSPLAWCLMAT